MSDRQQITLKLDRPAIEKLDNYSKELKITRQQLMENLIDTGLDDLKILKASGMLMIGTAVRDLAAKLRRDKEADNHTAQES